MDYILLLRGINVGGNRRVVMADLRAQLTAAGFSNVTSYINSGNLLFTTSTAHPEALVNAVLAQNYAFPIASVIIPAPAYCAAVAGAPTWWGAPGDLRHNVLFKLPGWEAEFDTLIANGATPYDQIASTDRVIFWSAPAKIHYSQAFYAKMLPQPFYPFVSIRNRNTTLKLAQLAQKRMEEAANGD